MKLFDSLKQQVRGKNIKIVFPEGDEPRILKAAQRLKSEGLIEPVLLGDPQKIVEVASANNISYQNLTIIDPNNYPEYPFMMVEFLARRKGKVDIFKAKELLKDVNYFGTMLTYMGKVDGMVSGAVHSTGDTVRPALQIIKTRPGITKTSGAFIMLGPNDERYLFADCAINIELTAEEMAEIAVESARNAKVFDIDPKVAMLSFSTVGSAKHPLAEKVAKATAIAKELAPDLSLDGEMQFDASIVPSVAEQKMPNSKLKGNANVFIFPSLEAGNIGYKIAQRLGGYEAIGPVLQGLNKPISDLSRGCNEEDVYKIAIITAAQSLL